MNEFELLQTKAKLRQHRVRVNFDSNHIEAGGIAQLQRMVANLDTLEDMAKWFGLSVTRMSVILQHILGVSYSEYLTSKNVQRSGVNNGR